GLLLLVSLVTRPGVEPVRSILAEGFAGGFSLWQALNQVISFVLITGLLALIYKLLPDAKIVWRDIWMGALLTAFLFTVGKYVIGLYLGQSSTTSVLGAGGSLVVLLVWVYYSSHIVLFGAQFTYVYSHQRN